jgi:cytochrome P450
LPRDDGAAEPATPDRQPVLDYPVKRRHPLVPPDYSALAGHEPVAPVRLPDGSVAWLVTGYDECRRALAHPSVSADSSRPGYPALVIRRRRPTLAADGPNQVTVNRTFMHMDPPHHDSIRRMLQGSFSPGAVRALDPMIRRTADDLIGAMADAGHEADLVESFTAPFPSLVICEILGVPLSDRAMFERETHRLLSIADSPRVGIRALRVVNDYLTELIAGAEENPGDDLIGRLVRESLWTGELRRDELLATVRLLLMAGLETTASMIGLGFARLLHDPGLYRCVRDDPALVPGAVEELLRFDTIIHNGIRRVALDDFTLGPASVRRGDGIIICVAAANRDPGAFDTAEQIDFRRKAARYHLSFSGGVHHCLGYLLARAELCIALSSITSAFPRLRLARPINDISFREDSFVYGPRHLPVQWLYPSQVGESRCGIIRKGKSLHAINRNPRRERGIQSAAARVLALAGAGSHPF